MTGLLIFSYHLGLAMLYQLATSALITEEIWLKYYIVLQDLGFSFKIS